MAIVQAGALPVPRDPVELQGAGARLDIREAHAAVRQLVEDTGAAIAAVLDA